MTDLKIEAGKCYRTRSGQKAMVLFVHPANPRHAYVGWIEHDPDIYAWDCKGYVNSDMCGDPDDLISEWKEPRKGEAWVNVYAETDGAMCLFAHDSREEADGHSDDEERLACIGPIPWTEGQGLDGEGGE